MNQVPEHALFLNSPIVVQIVGVVMAGKKAAIHYFMPVCWEL
jgi:hypothetical protein